MPRARKVGCCIVVIGVALALGGRARSADPDELIQQGVALRRNNNDEGALKLFEQAYEIRQSSKAAAQIGLAEQALGNWGRADRWLREALASTEDPWIRKHRGAIEDALNAVSHHVGRLEVSGSPPGAEVRVDGELVGRLPLDKVISVTAGGVAVEVKAPGFLSILRATSVPVGQLARERFQLQPLPQGMVAQPPARERPPARALADSGPPPARPSGTPPPAVEPPPALTETATAPPDREEGVSRRRIALGVAGIAAAALAVGIVEHVSWQSKAHSFSDNAACDNLAQQKGGLGCQGLYDAGVRARTIAFVGYGLAAGLAATATVLFVADPRRRGEPQKVACAPIGVTAGLGCSLRF